MVSKLGISVALALAALTVYGCQEKASTCTNVRAQPKLGLGTLTSQAEGWVISYIDDNGLRSDPIALDKNVALAQPLSVLDGHKVVFEGRLVDRPLRCGMVIGYGPLLKLHRLSVVK